MTGLPSLLVIAGPTASGKTALAVQLARHLGGEIVSVDSMQVYRDLRILTARPDAEELQGIVCHLSGHVDPSDQYHLQRFVTEADQAVTDIRSRGRVPILCGGTGLYLRGFLRGIFAGPIVLPELRRELEELASTPEGLAGLRQELARVDPEAFGRISPHDKIRLVRAVEIWRSASVPITELQRQFDSGESRVEAHRVVLDWPVEVLNRRIEQRARDMVAGGLLPEIESYRSKGHGPDNPAFRALGASSVVDCLEGKLSREQLVEALTLKTRQYGKRQRTWFRKEPRELTLEMDRMDLEQACQRVLDSLASA